MANAQSNEFIATGRRKTSVARARLAPGEGRFTVNDRSLDEYIGVPNLRMLATEPLQATQTAKKYNVAVSVDGGGIAGQAGAIRHAIARALLKASPELKPLLREKGLLTRDPRMKERKKYGQPGARKRFQFSKR
jgi:small subunit ribosomal protein S9